MQDAEAKQELKYIITEVIKANGFIEIDKFINLCLYQEDFGYYKTKNPFGLEGDFVTSPQMTSLFGEMIALFFASSYKRFTSEPKCTLIELGGGNGFFMRDCLNLLKLIPSFYKNLSVVMVETSELLIKEQKKILKPFLNDINICWKKAYNEALDETDEDEMLFVFSNEFFDAFALKQFILTEDNWHEALITLGEESGEFEFSHDKRLNYNDQMESFLLANKIQQQLPDESIIEISGEALSCFDFFARAIKQRGGIFLTIDYGYSVPSFKSSIKAVKAHKEVDVLKSLGEADITYLVNFHNFQNIGIKHGLHTYAPITQGDFFTSIGINARLQRYLDKEQDPAKQKLAKLAVERITSKEQMGELFKVIICEEVWD
jgi:SAM-dependent MidA family methyltransferase